MISIFSKKLSPETISKIKEQINTQLEDEQYDLAFKSIDNLLKAQPNSDVAAEALVEIVEDGNLDVDDALNILSEVYESHQENINLVSLIGSALEYARNIEELNLAPPEHPLFNSVVQRLSEVTKSGAEEKMTLLGLSTATRMMARQHDKLALFSYRRIVDIEPSNPAFHYSLGLLCKTRGLFREGMESNKKGLALLEQPQESYLWNLGICATGAGDGETALGVWKQLGNKIEMGRFNLPEGGYPYCKVKLAEFPLSERGPTNDDPGQQETIWIERLSPCHGIIRSVLYQNLGVDYGDVILIDGAPITYHKYGDNEVPVFPHLSTLSRQHYQFFDFVAMQEERGQINAITESLSGDSVVYVHTENFQILCATCWQDPNNDHTEHAEEEKCIVKGRIAAAKTISASTLLKEIDTAIEKLGHCEIFAPMLCKQSGLEKRADVEQRRFDLLTKNVR